MFLNFYCFPDFFFFLSVLFLISLPDLYESSCAYNTTTIQKHASIINHHPNCVPALHDQPTLRRSIDGWMCMTDMQLKTGVVNDAALRPPTTMAPPVPSKKKVSIPSVFLVDENKAIPGNGTATGVRTVDRPPPRPLRPPPVVGTGSGGGGGGAQMKCNTLNLSSSHSSLSPPQPPGHGSSQSQSQSLLSHHNPYLAESGQKQQMPQPHPPPRRHQMGGGGGGGPLVASGRGGAAAELQSKCLSVQVIVVDRLLSIDGQ